MKETGSLHEIVPVMRLEASQREVLAHVLGRAFHNDPNFKYVLPDEWARRDVLSSFFRVAIRAAQLYGHIYTTPMIDGGALWMCPGRELTLSQMVRTEDLAIRSRLDRTSFKRCVKLARRVEEVHTRLVREPHWYLMTLGVEPSKRGMGIGDALLEPLLSRADSDGLLCYLETFEEGNLRFYKKHGFVIAGAGCIPDGPSFWAMIRTPSGGSLSPWERVARSAG